MSDRERPSDRDAPQEETRLLDADPAPTLDLPTTWPPTDPAPTPNSTASPAPDPGTGSGRRRLRVRTVVFGLVLAVISAMSLVSLLAGVRVDAGAVLLLLLIGAGALLLGGALASAVREARGGPGAAR